MARLSERLTLAEEAASVAQANALDATAALTAVQVATATNASGEDALRDAVGGLDVRVHELQAAVATARAQAVEAAAAAAAAAAKAGRAPDDQVCARVRTAPGSAPTASKRLQPPHRQGIVKRPHIAHPTGCGSEASACLRTEAVSRPGGVVYCAIVAVR